MSERICGLLRLVRGGALPRHTLVGRAASADGLAVRDVPPAGRGNP